MTRGPEGWRETNDRRWRGPGRSTERGNEHGHRGRRGERRISRREGDSVIEEEQREREGRDDRIERKRRKRANETERLERRMRDGGIEEKDSFGGEGGRMENREEGKQKEG